VEIILIHYFDTELEWVNTKKSISGKQKNNGKLSKFQIIREHRYDYRE